MVKVAKASKFRNWYWNLERNFPYFSYGFGYDFNTIEIGIRIVPFNYGYIGLYFLCFFVWVELYWEDWFRRSREGNNVSTDGA